MKSRALIFVLPAVLLASGCAKVAHLQELLTIKGYSDEKDAQEKYVKAQDAKFTKLLAAIDDGTITKYTRRAKVQKSFGDPAYSRPSRHNGVDGVEELYRYSVRYFDSAKVYFDYDKQGKLLTWKYIPAPKGEEMTNEQKSDIEEKSTGNQGCTAK